MPHEFSRTLRIAEQIKRELAPLLQKELVNGPEGMVTITAVDVSPDLHQAKVYVSCLGEEAERAVSVLNKSSGHLRHHLAKHMHLKVIPRLVFIHDESVESAARIEALLNSLRDNKTS
jgi:ribosome-binding factor A